MFTHPIIHDDKLIRVTFSEFAKRHFLRNFEKKVSWAAVAGNH